jgi:Zn-dependent M28 family amino/carboxypeptidase
VEFSVGASDDGLGVVILLELLSNLVSDLSVTFSDVDLIVLFTSGEEIGLLGAKAFISHHSWRYDIGRFINIDSTSCNEIGGLIRMKSSQVFFSVYIYF